MHFAVLVQRTPVKFPSGVIENLSKVATIWSPLWRVTGLGNKSPLKVLNDTKLILDDHRNNLDSFRISLESFRSFRGPLLLKPVIGQELFFAVSYSKLALSVFINWTVFDSSSKWIFSWLFENILVLTKFCFNKSIGTGQKRSNQQRSRVAHWSSSLSFVL